MLGFLLDGRLHWRVAASACLARAQGWSLLLVGPCLDRYISSEWVFQWKYTAAALAVLVLSCACAVGVNIFQFACLGRFSAMSCQACSQRTYGFGARKQCRAGKQVHEKHSDYVLIHIVIIQLGRDTCSYCPKPLCILPGYSKSAIAYLCTEVLVAHRLISARVRPGSAHTTRVQVCFEPFALCP